MPEKSKPKNILQKITNHSVVAYIVVIAVIIISFGTLTDALINIFDFFSNLIGKETPVPPAPPELTPQTQITPPKVSNKSCIKIPNKITKNKHFYRITLKNECEVPVKLKGAILHKNPKTAFVSTGLRFFIGNNELRKHDLSYSDPKGLSININLIKGQEQTLIVHWGGGCFPSEISLKWESLTPGVTPPNMLSFFGGPECHNLGNLIVPNDSRNRMIPAWTLPLPRPRKTEDILQITSILSPKVTFNHKDHLVKLSEKRNRCDLCHHEQKDKYKNIYIPSGFYNCWVCHQQKAGRANHKRIKDRGVNPRIGHESSDWSCTNCHFKMKGPLYKRDHCFKCHEENEYRNFVETFNVISLELQNGVTKKFSHERHYQKEEIRLGGGCSVCHHYYLEASDNKRKLRCCECHKLDTWSNLMLLAKSTECATCHKRTLFKTHSFDAQKPVGHPKCSSDKCHGIANSN